MPNPLCLRSEQLKVIELLYSQQKQMYEQGSKRVDDRIVSLHQLWVRPIVRGKARVATEFGSKIAVSLPNVTFHSLRHSSTTYKLKLNNVYTSQARIAVQMAMHRT